MAIGDKMKGLLNQGKDLAAKAGAKAQNLGSQGLKAVEKKQLEDQVQKLLARLANEVDTAFTVRNQASIERDAPEIKPIMEEIASIRDKIAEKEAEIQALKNKNISPEGNPGSDEPQQRAPESTEQGE